MQREGRRNADIQRWSEVLRSILTLLAARLRDALMVIRRRILP